MSAKSRTTAALPRMIAPPLVPDFTFDADVALAFDVEWSKPQGSAKRKAA